MGITKQNKWVDIINTIEEMTGVYSDYLKIFTENDSDEFVSDEIQGIILKMAQIMAGVYGKGFGNLQGDYEFENSETLADNFTADTVGRDYGLEMNKAFDVFYCMEKTEVGTLYNKVMQEFNDVFDYSGAYRGTSAVNDFVAFWDKNYISDWEAQGSVIYCRNDNTLPIDFENGVQSAYSFDTANTRIRQNPDESEIVTAKEIVISDLISSGLQGNFFEGTEIYGGSLGGIYESTGFLSGMRERTAKSKTETLMVANDTVLGEIMGEVLADINREQDSFSEKTNKFAMLSGEEMIIDVPIGNNLFLDTAQLGLKSDYAQMGYYTEITERGGEISDIFEMPNNTGEIYGTESYYYGNLPYGNNTYTERCMENIDKIFGVDYFKEGITGLYDNSGNHFDRIGTYEAENIKGLILKSGGTGNITNDIYITLPEVKNNTDINFDEILSFICDRLNEELNSSGKGVFT